MDKPASFAGPAFLPGQLIEVSTYDGKPRDDEGEVYKVRWNYDKGEWIIYVRCFVAEGQEQRFRNFVAGRMEAK